MDKVKLVIWDLDNTIWEGNLDEGLVNVRNNIIEIVELLNSRGIVNSICSKNDYSKAKAKLKEIGIWDLFVFPVIEYLPKGENVRQIIEHMQLRTVNVAFVDDNFSNLEEVKYYNAGVKTYFPDEFVNCVFEDSEFGGFSAGKEQINKYKMLEDKWNEKRRYNNNTDFLYASKIRIELIKSTLDFHPRIYELIQKTNQLNFTKNRMSQDELNSLFLDKEVESKLIRAVDIFGDYGIIGFYAVKNNKLIHFVFSCRVLNMGIEQFVYHYIGEPDIEIVGEVASSLNVEMPKWIECYDDKGKDYSSTIGDVTKLIRKDNLINVFGMGACDLYHSMSYFRGMGYNLTYECNEFYGAERGVNTGTEYIRSIFDMNELEKEYCKKHFYNYTNAFNGTKIFDELNDIIVLSFHDDMVFKIFRSNNNSRLRVVRTDNPAYGLTSIIEKGEVISHEAEMEWLSKNDFDNGEFISSERFIDNLMWISKKAKKSIYLINGPEYPFFRSYMSKNEEVANQIKKINRALFDISNKFPEKFILIDINEVVKNRSDFTDYIFHLSTKASYALFKKIIVSISLHENYENRSFLGKKNIGIVGDSDLAITSIEDKLSLYHEHIVDKVNVEEFNRKKINDDVFYIISNKKTYTDICFQLEHKKMKPFYDYVVVYNSLGEENTNINENDLKININTNETWDNLKEYIKKNNFVVWGIGRGDGLNILNDTVGLSSMVGAIDRNPSLHGVDIRFFLNNESFTNNNNIKVGGPDSIYDYDDNSIIIITAMRDTESVRKSIIEYCGKNRQVFAVKNMEVMKRG